MTESPKGPSLIRFATSLPGRHRVAFLVTGTATLITSVLDTIGLALVAPTVDIVTDTGTGVQDNKVVDWTRSAFDWFGIGFELRWLIIIILSITLIRAIAMLIQGWITTRFQARYEADLRSTGYRAIMNASWSFFLGQRSGDLSNMLMEESRRSAVAFGSLNGAVGALLNIIIYVALATLISWQLTLATIGATLALLLIYTVLTRIARTLGRRASEANSDLVSEIGEGMSGAKIIKSEALEGVMGERFDQVVVKRARVEELNGVNNGLFVSTAELAFIGLLLGGLVLATRVMDLPSSTVLVFVLLFFRIYQRVRAFQSTILQSTGFLPSVAVVDRITTEALASVESDEGKRFDRLQTGVVFEDVAFEYNPDARVLDGVSLEIPVGGTVALVGPSGVGKTSVIDLAIGLLNPTSGRVLVDDVPMDEYSRSSWRSQLAYVSQETILFHDSVARNIAWGLSDVTDEEIRAAAVRAEADEFIQTLPDGYDTVVGDRGMRVSGGQRQRIALARAFLRNAELLILDEATSELDSESEARIQRSLDELRGSQTVLMVAHRLSTVMTADVIYVFEDGKIAESGSAEELLAKKGLFYRYNEGVETP